MRLKQNYIHKRRISGPKCISHIYIQTIMNVSKQVTEIYFFHKIILDLNFI